MNPKIGLAIGKSSMAEGVDLFNLSIGHGKATRRDAAAMDHEEAPGAAMNPIVEIGIAEIKR